MWLEIDANGIKIKLRIYGYKKTNKNNWDEAWCKCGFEFSSEKWLNYHKENDEILLSNEVEDLEDNLTKLIDNKILEIKEIACIEPDFRFKFYPQINMKDDPKNIYIRDGYEMQDIYLEWKIFFWNEGLTENYLTITRYRDDIVKLRDYLSLVITRQY